MRPGHRSGVCRGGRGLAFFLRLGYPEVGSGRMSASTRERLDGPSDALAEDLRLPSRAENWLEVTSDLQNARHRASLTKSC